LWGIPQVFIVIRTGYTGRRTMAELCRFGKVLNLDKDFEQQLELRRRNTRTPNGKRGKPKYTKGDLTVVD
jgi:hypothetical protein